MTRDRSARPCAVIFTAGALMVTNLGVRKPGDVSAYSWFNDDVRAIDGTLDAGMVDAQLRAGAM